MKGKVGYSIEAKWEEALMAEKHEKKKKKVKGD